MFMHVSGRIHKKKKKLVKIAVGRNMAKVSKRKNHEALCMSCLRVWTMCPDHYGAPSNNLN